MTSEYYFVEKIFDCTVTFKDIFFDEYKKLNIASKFEEFLNRTFGIDFCADKNLERSNFGANFFEKIANKITCIFFLHRGDFGASSASHFSVDPKENYDDLFKNNGDVEKNLYNFIKIDQKFDFRFIWFTKENRTCTVFPRLVEALKEQNEEELKSKFFHIWQIHDLAYRNDQRKELFKRFFEKKANDAVYKDMLEKLI